jgi:hypothetical protein
MMAPALKVLLVFLRTIRFARDYIKRIPGCGASLLAPLCRVWRRFWLRKSGSFGRPKPAERPVLGTEASSYSVSGGPAAVREYVVAASSVPASSNHPGFHEHTDTQLATVAQTVDVDPPIVSGPSVDHTHSPNSSYPRGGSSVNRSHGSLSDVSIRSRASERFSIITNSGESMRSPLGQPSRLPRATHRQFGRGPDSSRSKERPSRSPSPSSRPHTPPPPPSHLEIITTNLPYPAHGDSDVSPVVQPSTFSYAHPSLRHTPHIGQRALRL